MVKRPAGAPSKPNQGVGARPATAAAPRKLRSAKSIAAADHPEAGIGLALLKYFHWIEIGIRSYLRSNTDIELSRSEGLIIASVMLGYVRPSDIARQQGVSRQAIHYIIQQMRKKGIIELVPDATDGRIKEVALTDVARKMNTDGAVAMEYLWQELSKRIGQANLKRFSEVLHADWGAPITFGVSPDNEF